MPDGDIFVAMPVHRGAEFVAESLRSIRDQTYEGYRVLISVDPSDDASLQICRSFTSNDRIQVVEQPERLGWPGNFNWLVRQCDRPFFCYWQQDDLASTGYLQALRDTLILHPEAAVAYTDVQWFGARFGRDSSQSTFGDALHRVLGRLEAIEYQPLRGLIRSSAFPARADAIPPTEEAATHLEFVFLLDIAARGEFHRVVDALYFKRAHAANTFARWNREPDHVRRNVWISMGVGMLPTALAVAPPGEHARMLATLVDRLTIERPGRGFHLAMEQSAEAVLRSTRELVRRAGLEMTASDWSISGGSGFERPIHPWVREAIAAEVASQRVRQSLGSTLAACGALDVAFGCDQEGVHLLGDGWSSPEPWGTWSDGFRAEIRLPAGAAGHSVILAGHVHAPLGNVRIECAVDGRAERQVVRSDGEAAMIALDVPADVGPGAVTVALELPDAVSPASIGMSLDDRLLGFGITRLRIE